MEPIRPVDHVDLGLLLGVADRLTAAIAGATTAVAHPNSRWLFVGEQSPRQAFSYSESSWRIRHQGPQQWACVSRLSNRAASSRSRSPGVLSRSIIARVTARRVSALPTAVDPSVNSDGAHNETRTRVSATIHIRQLFMVTARSDVQRPTRLKHAGTSSFRTPRSLVQMVELPLDRRAGTWRLLRCSYGANAVGLVCLFTLARRSSCGEQRGPLSGRRGF